jgi:hypothetical protein
MGAAISKAAARLTPRNARSNFHTSERMGLSFAIFV